VTAVIERPATHAPEPRPPSLRDRLWAGRVELGTLAVLLLITALAHAANMHGWPQYFEDESTYVSQAWAVQTRGQLSHYTYWYDHPPGGWLQIAAWAWLTDAWGRVTAGGVQAGREAALVAKLVSTALLYVLGRRAGMRVGAAALAVLLFAVSPLSLYFHRMALLDNMLQPWVLGAFVLALSPQRRLAAYTGSAACLAVACQMKITSGLFLPILVYLLWKRVPVDSRRYAFTMFGATFAFLGSFWFLMALLKGELWPDTAAWFPGENRVSLLGTQRWVLFMRGGAGGSILDPESDASFMLHNMLLRHDRWLLIAGLAAAVLLLAVRRYRWIGLTMLLMVASIIRSNTLSWPFFGQFVPVAALAIGAAVDTIWRWLRGIRLVRPVAGPVVACLVALPVALVAPAWWEYHQHARTHDANAVYREAAAWMTRSLPQDSTVLLDNTLWLDLVLAGHDPEKVVWFWKLEEDREVEERFPDFAAFDFVVSSGFVRQTIDLGVVPETGRAVDRSRVLSRFVHPDEEGFPVQWERRGALVGHGYLSEYIEVRRVRPTEGRPATPGARAPDASGVEGRPESAPSLVQPGPTDGGQVRDEGQDRGPTRPTDGSERRTYVVRSGDTVSEIAERFGVTVAEIVAANDLEDPDVIRIDQELEIPAPATEG
jgi:hypothetical protein